MKSILICCFVLGSAGFACASGFGVFTQGASGLGQANAVVAHASGASSLYFNPALLNDLTGRQIELGTTGIYSEHSVALDAGGKEESKGGWNFPSTAFYTHQVNDKWSAGLGLFFPFGLSTEWDGDYAGRYLGTYGDIVTLDINPVVSYRLTERLSIAGGFSILYLDATLEKKINQTAAFTILSGGTPPAGPLVDIGQRFKGDGWGQGYNLGLLFKATDQVSVGVTYRSHIDVSVDGRASFSGVEPPLAGVFFFFCGHTDIRLPAQATAGIAFKIQSNLIVETGVRWEDWASTDDLKVELDTPVLGQTSDITPRDWRATWSYNIGGQYRISPEVALNAGYLFGENAVPAATFEPLVPDADAHLFTLGAEWSHAAWTVSGAFGYEYHQERKKNNTLGDPLGSLLAGEPTGTANGNYDASVYLLGLSLNYRF